MERENPKRKVFVATDPLIDLNTMQIAEKKNITDWNTFVRTLYKIYPNLDEIDDMVGLSPLEVTAYLLQATAAQRAEAFLRTIEKWTTE